MRSSMVSDCKCGFMPNENKPVPLECKRKPRYHPIKITNSPLINHIHFPTISLLSSEKSSPKPIYFSREKTPLIQWALLVEIQSVEKYSIFEGNYPTKLSGFSPLNELVKIQFPASVLLPTEPETFSWSDMKPGHTIAILYAEKTKNNDNNDEYVSPGYKHLNRVFVFKLTTEKLLEEAWTLINNADLIRENKTLECFG